MTTTTAEALTDFLRTLRQTRSYSTEPVIKIDLDAILEVARWTGSGGNKQPWRLVVIRDRATIGQLAALKVDTGWVAAAPVVIGIVTSGKTAESARFDAGRLVERTMLAATARGLAAAVIGFAPSDSEPALAARKLLHVPADLWITHAVVIGHPGLVGEAQPSKRAGRKSIAEIVVNDRFPAD